MLNDLDRRRLQAVKQSAARGGPARAGAAAQLSMVAFATGGSAVSNRSRISARSFSRMSTRLISSGGASPLAAPVITVQPVGAAAPTTLSVTATGSGLSYQWYEGASGVTVAPVVGEVSSTYAANPGATTSYWCRVSNSGGSADSSAASVTVTLSMPASATFRVKGDPDGGLTLTGSNVNTIIDSVSGEALTFGGAKATRQTAVLDGFNILRGSCDYYVSANTTAGKLQSFISCNGSFEAATGCFVGVMKATASDSVIFSCRFVSCITITMIDDAGTPKLQAWVRDLAGGITTVAVACSLNVFHRFSVRWDADRLYVSVDAGAESNDAHSSVGGVSNLNSRMELLGDVDTGGGWRGDFVELAIIGPSDLAAAMAYYAQQYPSAG